MVRAKMLCFDGGMGGGIPSPAPYEDEPVVNSFPNRETALQAMVNMALKEVEDLIEYIPGKPTEDELFNISINVGRGEVHVLFPDGSPLTTYFIKEEQ